MQADDGMTSRGTDFGRAGVQPPPNPRAKSIQKPLNSDKVLRARANRSSPRWLRAWLRAW